MNIKTGKFIEIDCGVRKFLCNSKTPGLINFVDKQGNTVNLPGNKFEAELFIKAYQRILSEDIKYREATFE